MVPNDYPLLAARARFLEMEMAIRSLRSGFRGPYSFRVEDLHSGMATAIGGDEAYSDSGANHVALCLYAFAQAAEGQLQLDAEVEYLPEDRVADTGPLQSATFGDRYSIQQLCQYALLDNDRIAQRMLGRTLGDAAVKEWLRTVCGRPSAPGSFGTSPADTVTLLKYLVALVERRPLLGGTLLEWMIHTGRAGLCALLPDGVRVAHSPVTTLHTVADAGFVFLPKAPYVVSIMVDAAWAPEKDQALEHLAQVSKVLYDHLVLVAGSFVGLHVNGERVVSRLPVCLYRGEPVGPVAEIAGALGVDVQTNPITRAVTLQRAGALAMVTPGDAHLQTQSDARILPVEPFLLEGICHAPLIPVFTALGVRADWDADCNRMALATAASN